MTSPYLLNRLRPLSEVRPDVLPDCEMTPDFIKLQAEMEAQPYLGMFEDDGDIWYPTNVPMYWLVGVATVIAGIVGYMVFIG